ncbi:uncharacterized protein LOC134400519 isoform X4 [Elgaria multicarinata webbii]|uniref:uncharacterized protein LOC134400519 isoform X4 n=1 Tax=Elgaria multicarinata webbii TaxID=159646 RepID=UPI002FCCE9DE
MRGQRLLLLLLRVEVALCVADCNPQYLKVGIEGKEIVLPLVVNGSADIIYWKKNEDIVAEWSKGDSAFLKDSVKNELTSHTLIIRNLLQNDSGIYKAEAQVNSEIQYTHFCLKILDDPYYQTRTGTRKHRNFLIIPIFITLGIIIMIVLRIKAFPKDIPEKEKEPLNEPRPVVENERQNNREDVLEGPGPSPEEGTLPVSGPKL